ncbi:MAG: Sugar phosphate isomerase/epimerase [Candidatus Poribacteria bacterium]|nr:Sugar phosphate isomerase/epimerase [Candidatus Poribacteria bacterium]
MKLSCIPICFFDDLINTRTMSLGDWVQMAHKLNLDGIEMYKPYLSEDQRDKDSMSRISDMIHSSGMEVSMFTSYADLSLPESTERDRQIASIRWDVDSAVIFRTSIVRLTAGRWLGGQSIEETLKLVAKGLKASLDYAEDKGIILALEDHPEVGTRIADFMRILELVDDERLKVNLDTSNPMESGDDPVELAKLVNSRIVHVHLSDRSADLHHQVAGEGVVDFVSIFNILRKAGYDGWLSLEAGGRKGQDAIHQALHFIRKAWSTV